MYRDDKPVLTNLVESDASPMLRPGPVRTGRVGSILGGGAVRFSAAEILDIARPDGFDEAIV